MKINKFSIISSIMIVTSFISCNKIEKDNNTPTVVTSSSVEPVKVKTQEDLKQEMLANLKSKSYDEMFKVCGKIMSDRYNNSENVGAECLVYWGKYNLKWNHVEVKTNETTSDKIRKNSAKEVGKKICVTGRIVQIEESGTINNGLLIIGYSNLFHFTNIGSSGDITEKSVNVRMCGIVVGQYHYNNSGGGVGHAIDLVGMWDLPENKINK